MRYERIQLLKEVLGQGKIHVDLETGEIHNVKTGRKLGHRGGTYCDYLSVGIGYNGKTECFTVHSVVAFVGGLDLLDKEVNHIDGNKFNNSISNLETVSSSENKKHAGRKGLMSKRLTKLEVKEIKLLLLENVDHLTISKQFGVSARNIWAIAKGHTHKDVVVC
jgi:hypothetical protein